MPWLYSDVLSADGPPVIAVHGWGYMWMAFHGWRFMHDNPCIAFHRWPSADGHLRMAIFGLPSWFIDGSPWLAFHGNRCMDGMPCIAIQGWQPTDGEPCTYGMSWLARHGRHFIYCLPLIVPTDGCNGYASELPFLGCCLSMG